MQKVIKNDQMNSLHSRKYHVMIECLAAMRQLKGITQELLATCLEKPQSYVSKYENGERRLDLIEVMDICKCIDYDIDDLIEKIKLEKIYDH